MERLIDLCDSILIFFLVFLFVVKELFFVFANRHAAFDVESLQDLMIIHTA